MHDAGWLLQPAYKHIDETYYCKCWWWEQAIFEGNGIVKLRINKMKIIVIFCVSAIVLCTTNTNLEKALHDNGSIYGWREEE